MPRYLTMLGRFWSTAFAAEMEYRVNFLLASLSSLGNLLGSLFSVSLFYRDGYSFAGWSWHQALIVLSIFTLLQGFSTTFLVPNLNRIVRHVQEGTLDFILLKPISSQFWLSCYTLSPWGIPDIIFGALLMGYAGQQLGLGPLNYRQGLLPLVLGFISLYSLWFMLGATSIWFVKIYNVTEVLRGLVEAGRFPMAAYPATYRFFFTFVVPVAFLTTVPAQAILQRSHPAWLLGSCLLSLVLLGLSHLIWQFALRFYTSASS
jgi:ABC-2 type transport system permease protein